MGSVDRLFTAALSRTVSSRPSLKGASTLVKCITGLMEAKAGMITFAGLRIEGSPSQDHRTAYGPEGGLFRDIRADESLEISHRAYVIQNGRMGVEGLRSSCSEQELISTDYLGL